MLLGEEGQPAVRAVKGVRTSVSLDFFIGNLFLTPLLTINTFESKRREQIAHHLV